MRITYTFWLRRRDLVCPNAWCLVRLSLSNSWHKWQMAGLLLRNFDVFHVSHTVSRYKFELNRFREQRKIRPSKCQDVKTTLDLRPSTLYDINITQILIVVRNNADLELFSEFRCLLEKPTTWHRVHENESWDVPAEDVEFIPRDYDVLWCVVIDSVICCYWC